MNEPSKLVGQFTSSARQYQRLNRFVTEHFSLRQCNRYVQVDLATEKQANNAFFKSSDCVCGQTVAWHFDRGLVTSMKSGEHFDSELGPWSVAHDTVSYPCNSYGKLTFVPGEGFDESTIVPGATADYIRLTGGKESLSGYLDSVYTLMTATTLWSLPAPQLIIEVAGMARKLQHVDQGVLDRFTTGLIRAAKTAKAWVVTSGTNTGIMGLVGDAVSKARMTNPDSEIVCVGIGPWGVVDNREQLINMDKKTVPPNESEKLKWDSDRDGTAENLKYQPEYTVERPENCTNGIALNPGHNCFLLVDNGKEKRFGEEIDFTAKYLNFLSRKTLRGAGGNVVATPFVLLVAGGGVLTLRTVELTLTGCSTNTNDDETGDSEPLYNQSSIFWEPPTTAPANDSHLLKNETCTNETRNRPIVLLPNFGGVSELLAFAYDISAPPVHKDWKLYKSSSKQDEDVERSIIPEDFDLRLMRHPAFHQIFQFTPENIRAEEEVIAIKRIRNCLQLRQMITVVDLSDGNNKVHLDHAILDAILKTNVGSPANMFELVQLWDRSDIAKELLGRYENEIRKHVDMTAALTRAIMFGQGEFFKLLVEYGLVNLNGYLTIYRMRCFYTDIFLRRRGKAGKATCVWLFRSILLNRITEETLANVANPELLKSLGEVLSTLLGCYMDNVITDEKSYKDADGSALSLETVSDSSSTQRVSSLQLRPYDTSLRDLLILQLLLHRADMALYIWKKGYDHLGTALMASNFLKSLAKEAKRLDMTDLATAYTDASREWISRAIALMASCYDQNPLICSQLLTRSLLTWQGATVLEIAFYGGMKKIMEQPAVQTTLAQIWLGRMATFTRQSLIYLTLFPPLMPFLIFRIRFAAASHNAPSQEIIAANFSPSRRRALVESGSQEQRPPSVVEADASSQLPSKQQDIKLTRASILNYKKEEGRISVFTAIYLLYSSPIAKYIVHSFAIVAFLFIFAYFILDGGNIRRISGLEIFICLSAIIFFFDVVREGFGKENLSVLERLEDFFTNISNIAEVVSLLLIATGFLIKIFLPETDITYAHTIYSLACVLYWLKTLRIFFVTESVGPKVITLVKMLRDLAFFIFIYVILLLSFSIPIYALVYPFQNLSSSDSYFALMLDISYDRVWNLFYVGTDQWRETVEGTCPEESYEEINMRGSTTSLMSFLYNDTTTASSTVAHGPQTPGFGSGETCSRRNLVAIALYIIYLLLTNIMLLNMIIAMFSHTVDKTRLSATRLWRFDMYRFLYEYYCRPILPGPLMAPELAYRFYKFIYRRTCGEQSPVDTDLSLIEHSVLKTLISCFYSLSFQEHFYRDLKDSEYRKLDVFERTSAESLLAGESRQNDLSKINETLTSNLGFINEKIQARIDHLETKFNNLVDAGHPLSEDIAMTLGETSQSAESRNE